MNGRWSILFIILLNISFLLKAQVTEIPEGYIMRATVVDGDTMPTVRIKPVVILPPLKLTNKRDVTRYNRLIRDVKRVYPYAMIAKDTFAIIQKTLDTITDKRERKDYLQQKDDELQARYTKELKRLTVRQGHILIKLIDRELDQTSYEIIKELRGSLSAFFWQQIARLFGESLKSEYDSEGEDLLIERIVIMIENGQI